MLVAISAGSTSVFFSSLLFLYCMHCKMSISKLMVDIWRRKKIVKHWSEAFAGLKEEMASLQARLLDIH